MRLLGLLALIALACLGIGLAGAAPLPFAGRKNERENAEKTELVETPQTRKKKGEAGYFLE